MPITGATGKVTTYGDPPVIFMGAVVPPEWPAGINQNINRWLDGMNSFAGLIVDSVGGVLSAARAATSALIRSQASDGTARSLTDYLGFRTGPVVEVYESFMGVKGTTTGAQTAQSWGGALGWTMTCGANCRSGFYGPLAGGQLTNLWPTGAYVLELQSARTNSDSISFYSPAFYNCSDSGSTSYILNKTVTVNEWTFAIDTNTANTDWFQGMVASNSSSPVTTAAMQKLGIRFAPSLGDATIKLIANAGSVDGITDTAIAPANGTLYRCRLEMHRSGTPFGAVARLFINGALVQASGATLPINNPIGADMNFEYFLQSTSNPGTRSGLELGYHKLFKLPLGSLAAGATTSDV